MSMGPDSFDSFDFNMDDVDADHVSREGGGKLPEGEYRMSIVEVILQNERGSIQVECEVIAAKDASLVGRKHKEYLRWPSADDKDGGATAKRIILAWCYATKTTTAEEIKARQQARQGFNSGWLEAMVGRHVLVFVKAGEYEGKLQAKIQGNVWSIDDPKRNKMPGWAGSTAAPATTNAAAPAAPVTAPAPQQAPAVDPFAGLV